MNNNIYETIKESMDFIVNNNMINNSDKLWCLLGIHITFNELRFNGNITSAELIKLNKYYNELSKKLED